MTHLPSGDVELNEATAKFIEMEWRKFLSHIKDLGYKFHLDSFDAQYKSEPPHSMSNRIIFHVDGTVECHLLKKTNEKL